MAGYDGHSKSNNAVDAEGRGLMVASKLSAIVKRHRRYRGATASDIAAVLPIDEWHHTSKKFNRVNYYDLADLMSEEYRAELRQRIDLRRRARIALREATARGMTWLLTRTGERWYPISATLKPIDVARLEHQLVHGHGESDN